MSEEEKKKEEDILNVSSKVPLEPIQSSPIREDIVNNAVSFLKNDNIRLAPKEKKVSFLQRKGLTNEEIQEAFSRAEKYFSSINNQPSSLPPSNIYPPLSPSANYPYPVSYPQAQPPVWYATKSGLALTAVACVGVGVGVSYLTQKYFSGSDNKELQQKLQKEREEREKEKERETKLLEGLTSTLKSIENQNSELKTFMTSLVTQQPGNLLPNSNTIKSKREIDLEIKLQEQQSQIENLRMLILDQRTVFNQQKSSWIPPTSPVLPSWQTDPSRSYHSFDTKKKATLGESPFDEMAKSQKEKETSTSTEDKTPYPLSFQKINEMVANGQPIPGVRTDIDDKPLDPNAKLEKGSRDSATKPWASNSKGSVITPQLKDIFSTNENPPKVEEVQENP